MNKYINITAIIELSENPVGDIFKDESKIAIFYITVNKNGNMCALVSSKA